MAAAARISVNIHELVSKNITSVSKKGKNTSQTGKQFGKYFHCFCLAEALLAEAEVKKTPQTRRCSKCTIPGYYEHFFYSNLNMFCFH